jgi:hypothetical protein
VKFLWTIIAYLMMGVVLSWGILEAARGQPWLLIVGSLAYIIAFAKLGCLPKGHG